MKVLLFSMPDSFEHTPSLTMRMPNGALTSLAGSRQRHGDTLTNELVINLHGRRSASSLGSAEQRVLDDYVSRLRTARIDSLAGYGRAKTLVIPLAPLSRAISPRPEKT